MGDARPAAAGLRVLPRIAHGIRPGQVWRDPEGRLLAIRNVMDEIGKVLCIVLNPAKRARRGACVDMARLEARGTRLVEHAPVKCQVCRSRARLVGHNGIFACSAECWALVSRVRLA